MDSTLVASQHRPLGLLVRRDLTSVRQSYQGRDFWVVKDPLSLKFYRFEEEEYALLQMLDGRRSAEQIKRQFDTRFAPQRISLPQLYRFIGMLFRSSLVVSSATGQGPQLLSRAEKQRRQLRRASVTNILAIRFKGFDPDPLLQRLSHWLGWFFSTPAILAALVMIVCAAALVLVQFDSFQNRLPGFREFFASQNWIWLAATLALTKVLHELGHGLACKRLGGQCHEMGVMLLVLTPCLYCNVSDSWMLPSKWKRAGIALAGIYVELVLAALCTFIWWFSHPGMVNQLALNVMVISSVTTILFNANPLLRYDGYYVLSDLLEIPNLRQKANTLLQRAAGRWCLGLKLPDDPFLPTRHRWLFAAYSVAAAAYRWLIMAAILWFVYKLLEPYGLQVASQLIAATALYGLVARPLVQLVRFFLVPGRISTVKRTRLAISGAVATCLLIFVLLIPVPRIVRCPLLVQPQGAANVYVEVPGAVEMVLAAPHQLVQQDEPILQLSSLDLQSSIASLEATVAAAHTRYKMTHRRASIDPEAAEEVDTALATYHSAFSLLQQRQVDLERLQIRAPITGHLIAADYVAAPAKQTGTLGGWHGHALEVRNCGAYLEEGTMVCRVVPDLTRLDAVLAIDQNQIEFVRDRQPVEIRIHQQPGRVFRSSIASISPVQMKTVPKALSSVHGGAVLMTTGADGKQLPQSSTYQVKVPFADPSGVAMHGCTGIARIHAGYATLGSRLWRMVCQTFRFEL